MLAWLAIHIRSKKNKIPKKGTNTQRILALDAATGVTGYAIYDDKVLVGFGTFKTSASLPATERINQVKNWLKAALKEWEPDFVGIENIQLQHYGKQGNQLAMQVKTFQTLANLQGVLLDTIFEASIDSDIVYPTEWRSYCGIGDGDQHRDARKKAA
jgi:Holliday junction resolvasome RuvABC endonuclease subunit